VPGAAEAPQEPEAARRPRSSGVAFLMMPCVSARLPGGGILVLVWFLGVEPWIISKQWFVTSELF
jgi:hypothetical protein